MKHDDIKIGEYYKYNEIVHVNPTSYLIYIVGRDPFTGKLIATSDVWLSGVDVLDDFDFELMEPI